MPKILGIDRVPLPKDTKSNLDNLTRKEGTLVYATDLKKAFLDDGSSLVEVGSGSGSGGRNYIHNPSASTDTSGWSVSGGGSLTRHTTAADLPRASTTGTGFAFTSDADEEYAYTRFTLDAADLTKKMITQLAYNTSAATFRIELWQNDQSDYAGTYTEIPLTTDSSGDTALNPSVKERTTYWDASGSAYIELRVVHEGTDEDTIYFSDVDVHGIPPPQGLVGLVDGVAAITVNEE